MDKKQKFAIWGLIFVALMAAVTVVAHMSCIWLGEACYRAQLAPKEVVESAKNGTLFAPIATVGISFLFALCGAYALAGAGLIKRLPLTYIALWAIGVLCTLRGIVGIGFSLVYVDMVTVYSFVATMIWFTCGVITCFAIKWVPTCAQAPNKSALN
ncbi:hypothetical protein L1077_13905 [Pseudoalteromonas luteoviolacea]|uniref:hypothetical protein n=1 Tax=Pseudoalteromonas luteoviolacea TaxID=43657 RepID=UPI001F41241F|nr:hypothetical protein [Pseudoalteromonas luteoviolacea]MCF6440527.1 hypothetical protein [Pseudoalteromonas luteoviolacea]